MVTNARTHTNTCVCDTATWQRTKRRFGLGAPLQRNHYQVFLWQNCLESSDRNWKKPTKASEHFFFSLSFLLLNISTRHDEIQKMRNVSTAVILFYFLMFHGHLCLRDGLRPTLFCASPYMAWCARATRVKQNSLIMLQTLMRRCRAAGPVRGAQASQLCLTWAVQ